MDTNTTVSGLDQWNQRLLSIMDSTIKSVGDAKDFVVGQLPDVIQQTLTWYMVYNLILFVVALIIPIVIIVVIKMYGGVGEKINPELSSRENHKWTITHDDDGNLNFTAFITGVVSLLLLTVSAICINLEWLKILIAPKLWLIEYAAHLTNING